MLQIQGQLQSNQVEIANREHSIEGLKAQLNLYQGRLNQEPVREQQLTDLTRGYEQSKANYDELLKKKNGSEMATSMELRQQGEHFRILDPPSLPVKPSFPNRLKLCGIGLVVGVFLGAAVSAGAELIDDRLFSEKELKETGSSRRSLRDSESSQPPKKKKSNLDGSCWGGSRQVLPSPSFWRAPPSATSAANLGRHVQSFLQSEA